MTPPDDVLGELLGGSALLAFWRRCADRFERLGDIRGTVAVADDEERRLVGRILRRRLRTGQTTVRLIELDAAYRAPEVGSSLQGALERVLGRAMHNFPAEAAAGEAARGAFWQTLAEHTAIARHPSLLQWLDEQRQSGALSRRGLVGSPLTTIALDVLGCLPVDEPLLLQTMAAHHTGSAHGLDPDTPLGSLVLSGLAHLTGNRITSSTNRREAWAAVGVATDDLSSSVIVLNLQASGSPLADLLQLSRDQGEPLSLTLSQLSRWVASTRFEDHTVFVCENPGVVRAAASKLRDRSSALVCTNGNLSAAAMVLLRGLAGGGADLRFHADFDAGGLLIASAVHRLGGAPWRYETQDYEAALANSPGERTISGRLAASRWDAGLAVAIGRAGCAVHEEHLVETLVADLVPSDGA